MYNHHDGNGDESPAGSVGAADHAYQTTGGGVELRKPQINLEAALLANHSKTFIDNMDFEFVSLKKFN